MIPLGLSQAEREALEDRLTSSHEMRIEVHILDRDENYVGGLITDRVLSGAVNVDTTQSSGSDTFAPSRQLQMEFVDLKGELDFVPDSPGDTAVFADNMIQVRRGVYVDDPINDWVDIPVFRGPISRLEKQGRNISVEAEGKEALALDPNLVWQPQHLPKGLKTVDAIRRIMAAQGETRFALPELGHKLHHGISLERHAQPWKIAQHLAASVDRQLFYDGSGTLRLRAHSGNRVFYFKIGDGGSVISRVHLIYDLAEVRNVVELIGPKVDGPKKRLRAVAVADRNHPLSPWSLSRNGEPRFMVHWEEVGHAKRQYLLNARARHQLDNLLGTSVDVTFEALPIPHLEELDRVAVDTSGQAYEFSLRKFTIPLAADSAMSVGTLARISSRSRKRKRNRGGGHG